MGIEEGFLRGWKKIKKEKGKKNKGKRLVWCDFFVKKQNPVTMWCCPVVAYEVFFCNCFPLCEVQSLGAPATSLGISNILLTSTSVLSGSRDWGFLKNFEFLGGFTC